MVLDVSKATMEGCTVRSVSLCIYIVVGIFVSWFWWGAVHVDRHSLPDLCAYPQSQIDRSHLVTWESSRSFTELHEDGPPLIADAHGSCVGSPALRVQPQLSSAERYVHSLFCSEYRHPGSLKSATELWTTSIFIVPQCRRALEDAKRVYAHLLELGDAPAPPKEKDGECVAIPASVLLAAIQTFPSSVAAAAASRVLTVRLLDGPLDEEADCKPFKDSRPRRDFQELSGSMEALHTLTVVVSTVEQRSRTVSVHLGEDSTVFLEIVGGQLQHADEAALPAQAVVQTLGRILAPPTNLATAAWDPQWQLRFWLLKDVRGGGAAKTSLAAPAAGARQNSLCAADAQLQQGNAAELVRTHMGRFLRKLSFLVDLTVDSQVRPPDARWEASSRPQPKLCAPFESRQQKSLCAQVVPESGLWRLAWNTAVAQRESQRQTGLLQDSSSRRAREAASEETARRFAALAESWGGPRSPTPPSHVHPRVVNLGLYTPLLATQDVPRGTAFLLPGWGFLTFGMHLCQTAETSKGARFDLGETRLHEEVAAAWKLQLRAEIGLLPQIFGNSVEQNPDEVAADAEAEELCSAACLHHRRSQWRVRAVEERPLLSASHKPFALAMLEATSHSQSRAIAIYRHLDVSGVADWEIASVAVTVHSNMLKKTVENLAAFTHIAKSSVEIRLPERIKAVFQVFYGRGMVMPCSSEVFALLKQSTLPSDFERSTSSTC